MLYPIPWLWWLLQEFIPLLNLRELDIKKKESLKITLSDLLEIMWQLCDESEEKAD